jgi:hypothetical protein
MPLKNNKNIHPMEYKAQTEEEINVMKALNKPLKDFFDLVDNTLPESADKTVLLRSLLSVRTQLNQTIVLNGLKEGK